MMREIKFRAFKKNVPSRGIYPVESIDFKKKGVYLKRGSGNSFWVPFHAVELMQYTGLNDKNGKEIYEGDILDALFVSWYLSCPAEREVTTVKYKNLSPSNLAAFWPFYVSNSYSASPSKSKVIGNVYENPELLKNDR